MPSSNDRPFATIVASTSICLLLAATPALGRDASRAVRAIDAELAQTLRDTYQVSPTLRRLVDELEHSDIIVHIVSMKPRPRVDGALVFVHAGSGRRILRIAISQRLATSQRAAVLAHELQHAVEVARSELAIDHASFADLYQRIGYRELCACTRVCYETDEARRVAARVLKEWQEAEETGRTARSTSGRPIGR